MFEDYKRRHRGYAAANRVKFSVTQSVVVLFTFTVLFRNVIAGLAGAVVALVFGLYWWRPGGPGRRRLQGRNET
jgi:hypothetical protein